MYVYCPHCTRQLKISEAVFASLRSLPPEKLLKVQCVHCKQGFQLDSRRMQKSDPVTQEEQQPLFDQRLPQQPEESSEEQSATIDQPPPEREGVGVAATDPEHSGTVQPPVSPDISWLSSGEKMVRQMVEGRPRALLVVPQGEVRNTLVHEIGKLDYHLEEATGVDDALEKIVNTPYTLVFYHSDYEKGGLDASRFHRYLSRLSMTRRRDIFYVLVGKEMRTLYDLQALASSANLVVNDAEVGHIGAFLPRAMEEYQEVLGPLLEELHLAGK